MLIIPSNGYTRIYPYLEETEKRQRVIGSAYSIDILPDGVRVGNSVLSPQEVQHLIAALRTAVGIHLQNHSETIAAKMRQGGMTSSHTACLLSALLPPDEAQALYALYLDQLNGDRNETK